MKQFKNLEDSVFVESGSLQCSLSHLSKSTLPANSRASTFGTLYDAADETTGKISGLLAPHR